MSSPERPFAADANQALTGPPGQRRGFALLLVLWALALIALVVTQLTATGRTQTRVAQNLLANAVAEAAADGAVRVAFYHLLDTGTGHWAPDGASHRIALPAGATPPSAVATVRILDLGGKINPNLAPPELLAALLRVLKVPDPTADSLAAAIADWREAGDTPRPGGAKRGEYLAAGLRYGPPGSAFERVEELGRVLGMTPAILAALTPHLSVDTLAPPDPDRADEVVLAALRQVTAAPAPPGPPAGAVAVELIVDAQSSGGGRFRRHVTAQVGPSIPDLTRVRSWEQE